MLKLAKLPDRTPVKLTVTLNPELHQRLQSYAALYRETYGTTEPVADLIPYMLDAFLNSDRTYTKVTKVDRAGGEERLGSKTRRMAATGAAQLVTEPER